MHVKLKILLIVALAFVTSIARSDLVWEQTQLELHPAVGDETAVGHFKYQNKGDKVVAIKSVTTSCGCTAASAKQTADPGEKGEVTATFKVGDRTGTQQKAITVLTDDASHPSTTLTLKVVIPVLVDLQPTFVFWQSGEPPKAKTILAKAGPGVSIKNVDVTSSSPDFTAKVERGTSPNEFRINVEPHQTTQSIAATLTVKPTLEKGPPKLFYATARVMPPTPAAQASAAPNSSGAPAPSVTAAKQLPAKSRIDACALLNNKAIQIVQGEPLKDSKASGSSSGGLAISQCYFALPTSSNSISLTVTQKGDGADARDPKELWAETFHHEKAEREEEEGEKKPEPEKIPGVGDEAFWMGNRVGGELYALKGNTYIRISVGGGGDPTAKIKKSKDLAAIVLKQL